MRPALAPVAALLVGTACGLLLADLQPEVFAQGQGGGKGGGKGGGGTTQCFIDSVVPVAFGIYDPGSGSPEPTTGQINFSCRPSNRTVTVNVMIGASGVSGSITDRAMQALGGTDQLHYNLFQDQRGSVVWGDGQTGGSAMVVSGAGTFSLEIYGLAFPNQDVSEDVYADTVEISIQY